MQHARAPKLGLDGRIASATATQITYPVSSCASDDLSALKQLAQTVRSAATSRDYVTATKRQEIDR